MAATSVLKLDEVIVDAALNKLRNGLGARVSAINAADTDGVTVEAPDTRDLYAFGINELPRAPALVVTTGATDYAGEGPRSWILQCELIVFIVEEDTDRERLGRKLLRQQAAVMECLLLDDPGEQLTGSAYSLQPRSAIPGRVFEPQDDQVNWRQSRIVTFTATQAEN